MKKKIFEIFMIIGVLTILLIMNGTQVQAALQSNPNTHYIKKAKPENWFPLFRNMEATGGALGLNETKNSTTMLATESNNLDSHMMKNTEYGAIAILSASGYGNPTTLQKSTIKTTTGNETGIYYSGTNAEFVAGGTSGYIFPGIDSRYYDTYGNGAPSTARRGDGLGTGSTTNPGCNGWHSATQNYWVNNSHPLFERGEGGLFSFNKSYFSSSNSDETTRGVVVCAEGL